MCRCWQVVHQGQVIGAVLADTLTNAQRAAAAVLVHYDVMEPIITIAVSHKNAPLTKSLICHMCLVWLGFFFFGKFNEPFQASNFF